MLGTIDLRASPLPLLKIIATTSGTTLRGRLAPGSIAVPSHSATRPPNPTPNSTPNSRSYSTPNCRPHSRPYCRLQTFLRGPTLTTGLGDKVYMTGNLSLAIGSMPQLPVKHKIGEALQPTLRMPQSQNITQASAISSSLPRSDTTLQSLKVAVIGAGAAGLVAARELIRQGHSVTVYEQDPSIGGIWQYDESQEDDPLGLSEKRREVHSSMYSSLRTNLPREVMGFTDFPFNFPLPGDPPDGCPDAPDILAYQGLSDGSHESSGADSKTVQGECTETLKVDPRRFPGHTEVLRYLKQFVQAFDLARHIRFSTKVVDVRLASSASTVYPESGVGAKGAPSDRLIAASKQGALPVKFMVQTKDMGKERKDDPVNDMRQGEKDDPMEGMFDAVIVCNGHYSQPRVAHIPGIQEWPGEQMHSHNYRQPEIFAGKVVVLLGAASSGDDLSKEISSVAKSVHMTSRGWTAENVPTQRHERWPNLFYHPMIRRAHGDGSVEFGDGLRVKADVIFYCTGYRYSFPFLESLSDIVSIEDNRVGPLYRHVLPPTLAPWLSFLGLPWKVVPFPLMELQAKWVAHLLSGRTSLPSIEEMLGDVEEYYKELKEHGIPQDYTHCLNYAEITLGDQFSYDDWLASECGYPTLPPWRKVMYKAASQRKRREPWSYRDSWDDNEPFKEALMEFQHMKRSWTQKPFI